MSRFCMEKANNFINGTLGPFGWYYRQEPLAVDSRGDPKLYMFVNHVQLGVS